jgi:hypothetical protein
MTSFPQLTTALFRSCPRGSNCNSTAIQERWGSSRGGTVYGSTFLYGCRLPWQVIISPRVRQAVEQIDADEKFDVGGLRFHGSARCLWIENGYAVKTVFQPTSGSGSVGSGRLVWREAGWSGWLAVWSIAR